MLLRQKEIKRNNMKVSPSILSADFSNLRADIEAMNASQADYLHIDVMDGIFVPNISFGFPVIKAVQKVAAKPLDVHLMIVKPENWISQVRDTGAEIMNVHQEACLHLHRTIQSIKQAGMKAGVTLNPSTPISTLTDVIEDLDLVLIMSVNPGFGGQKFIPQALKKVVQLRQLIKESGSHAEIEVDGGVTYETAKPLAEAGADILVAGSYVFNHENPAEAVRLLKSL